MIDDFFEEDEDVRDLLSAFDQGEKGVTARRLVGYRCDHMNISGSALVGRPRFGCGCDPDPVFSTTP